MNETFSKKQSLLAHGLLLAIVAVWGATFGLVKSALHDCSPLLFNQIRMILAFAALGAIHWRQWRHIRPASLFAGAVAGLFLALGYELQTAGLAYTTAARSAFLTGLVVVLVPLLCVFPALRPTSAARPGLPAIVGAIGAFVGIVLLTCPPGSRLQDFTSGINRGDVLSFGCAVAFALHLLSLAHLARRVPTSHLATLQIGFAALFMSFATPVLEHTRFHWTGSLALALGVCSLVATALAFSVQSWAQQHLAPSHTAMLMSLEPAFALVTALLFFGESLSLRSGTGAAIILLSLLPSELFATSPASQQPEANTA